jgi:hypothetical protein
MRGMKRAALIVLGVAAASGLLWWASLSQAAFSCEACIEVDGRRLCQTVRAASEDAARQTAVSNVCNSVGRDLTERLACQNAPTTVVVCGRP